MTSGFLLNNQVPVFFCSAGTNEAWRKPRRIFSSAKGFTFGREKAASTMEGMTAAPKVVKYIFLHWVWGPNLLRNLPSNPRTTGNISPAKAALWSR